jgi:hypothetical protein
MTAKKDIRDILTGKNSKCGQKDAWRSQYQWKITHVTII